jgi:excisionase family DNA binding protein
MPAPEPAQLPRIDQYLSRSQAAELLGVHPTTVYRWGKAGLITEHRLPSGKIRYSPDEVATVLAEIAEGDAEP